MPTSAFDLNICSTVSHPWNHGLWWCICLACPAASFLPSWPAQVWDPEAAADTSSQHNRHQHKLTPYAGMALKGKVIATYVNGNKVFDERQGVFEGTCGSVIRRKWLDIVREQRQVKDEM